ncbi:MAG: RidA family protein [Actinomycetota bacterium]|jgi:hypothetical protein|nr:RidA family protein [Actinomycetota bacterium]MEC9473774.1 RidA family protein [Actinomycetota bacterium]MED5361860.1 RidA family protein [Actinomycetota bacterium]
MNLRPSPVAPFSYVPGIDPYSGGVVAAPGAEIIHVTLREPLPWRDGFERIKEITANDEVDHTALCAVELRCPVPHSFEGFIGFNDKYRSLLDDWGLLNGDDNPIARTNVAPVHHPPNDTSLYAFSYVKTVEGDDPGSFVVAGAGDLMDQSDLQPGSIVAKDLDGEEAWRSRIEQVCQEMEDRMSSMGVGWHDCTVIDVYCAEDWFSQAGDTLIERIGPALAAGLHWHVAHPPIEGLRFEMDVRSVGTEKTL